ncbi:MAG: hypothetical protein H7246_12945, partial [Phycisphaerae bacterium]|nr:hypothetical protein [Saprospiraceae bacterium]
MKNKLLKPRPTLLWAILLFPFALGAQNFFNLPGPMGTIRSLLKGPNGELYLGSNSKGVFHSMDNGQNWTGLGGNTIMTGRINDLVFDTSGQLVAATEQGGVKKWNGTGWNSINIGLFSTCGILVPIRDLTVAPGGTLFAGAHGYGTCFPVGDVYRFEGSGWASVAAGLANT